MIKTAEALVMIGRHVDEELLIRSGIVAYLLDKRFNSLTEANCLAKIHPANSYSGLPSSLN